MFGARRTLRLRVGLGAALAAAALHSLLSVAVLLVCGHYYFQRFDATLRRHAQFVAAALSRHDKEPAAAAFEEALGDAERAEAPETVIADLRAGDGQLLDSTTPGAALPLAGTEESLGQVIDLEGSAIGRPGAPYHLVTMSAVHGSDRLYVQEAESSAPVLDSLHVLRSVLFLGILPIAILGSGLAAWHVAGRTLSRIDQVAFALRRVRDGGEPGLRVDVRAGSDEIGTMVAEMNGVLARLDSAFKAQERFIMSVTHELKTPVSIVLAEAQLLKRSPAISEKAQREFVLSVEEEMRRLSELVEGFLTQARAGLGQRGVENTLVSLNEVIIESIRRASSAAAGRGNALVPMLGEGSDGEPLVRGDQELLTMALSNLERNAIEDAPPGSSINVALEQDGEQYRVSVSHVTELDGEGRPRSHASSGRQRSRELAMEVARGIARLHGGDISTRQDTGGSRAILRVPLSAGAA